MSSYNFLEKSVGKPGALDQYIRKNVLWDADFNGLSTDPLTIYTNRPLSETELSELTTLIENYIDPSVFLTFNHTETVAMHSPFVSDTNNVVIDNKKVLQTLIFTNRNNGSQVLDSCKTVIEYFTSDVQQFNPLISESITLEIYDITRNTSIAIETIDNVASSWTDLAVAGGTGSSTLYKSIQFTGLMNKTPGYDCVWQLRGSVSDESKFTFRINGLQYIFYDVI